MNQSSQTWIFQASPKIYDIDRYLTEHDYIYFRAKQGSTKMKLGDVVWQI